MTDLFNKDLVFVSNAESKDELFKEIYDILRDKDLVKDNFYEMIVERENNYPTGLDMSVVNENLSNIAIPHTEPSTVNVTKIIPVKLINKLEFANMIDPDRKIEVDFAFIILNNNGGDQTNILSSIMDFVTQTDDIQAMFDSTDSDYIYNFIEKYFNK
ncbi:PTS sugar transporter subunit IIA [Anaerococcus sp. AGMB09787]|uniref:PTS sugar transporter subunit IIA n=1 Tax=Anaerococcus sp. AGMB09787 TaxID=2922869 RepID=UPI001FAE97C4|nr:PTS sugar transporter subunit IIA [Anaerococcus sp. AGMB09787]